MSRRIALVLPNWVGDVVMATPALRAVRESFPDAELIGIGKPYVRGLLDGSPWLDGFIPITSLAQALAVRRRRIDVAVLFPNSFRSALFTWLAGCKRRIGYARHGRTPLLTDRLYATRDARGRFVPSPILLDYNRLAESAGAVVRSHRLELFTALDDEAAADEIWERAKFHRRPMVVTLNPGAAFGAAKLWPREYFAALARRLANEFDAGVLVLCGPAERDLARSIVRAANHPFVRSLADENVSLGLTKACVRRSALLVSTDSGPRHFAAAFDRPVVALFGPTHIEWTQTYHPREVQLQERVPCGPCQRRACPTDHRCMRDLSPETVFRAAARLLAPRATHAA
jgi:heptosyltransferase-2